jgi:predicted MFS family arabinose efflux permease
VAPETVSAPTDQRFAFLGDIRGRAALVVLGCLVCQLALGYGYVFSPLASMILPDFGWTRTEYFAVRIPQLVAMSLASPILGMIVVRSGARTTLVVSAVLLGTSYALLSRIQEIWHLYALLMLSALPLVGLGDISVGQLVTNWVERRRGLALGLVYAGSNLAGFLLVPIWVSIAREHDWRAAFLVMGLGAFVVMIPAILLLVRDRALDRDADSAARGPVGSDRDLRLAQAVRTRSFWILAFCVFAFFFYFVGILDHMVLLFTDGGMSGQDATLFFSRALGLGLASKVILGAISDYIPEKTAILADHGLLAASALVLLLLPDDNLVWVFIVSYGFATAARDVVYPLILNRCFGERYMAEIYGALMLALPGGSIGSIFAAQVYDRTGSYQVALVCFAALTAAAVVGLTFVRDERRS